MTPNEVQSFMEPLVRFSTAFPSRKRFKITVFFDEINTASCSGVFKEIMCDHSLNGNVLPPSLFCIAACNPKVDKSYRGTENEFRHYYQVTID